MNIIRAIKLSVIILGIAGILIACKSGNDNVVDPRQTVPVDVIQSQGISVPVYDFQAFRPLLDLDTDTLYIFNFWATWCQPCVKEMPYFNMADSAYADMPVRIVLVSLDFIENVETHLIPFIIENELRPEVIILDDMDANSWIPQIDNDWEGTIPATLFIQRSTSKFFARSFTYEELTFEIESILNP